MHRFVARRLSTTSLSSSAGIIFHHNHPRLVAARHEVFLTALAQNEVSENESTISSQESYVPVSCCGDIPSTFDILDFLFSKQLPPPHIWLYLSHNYV